MQASNVLLYIADSVRWDLGKKPFSIRGSEPIKTAAHSTFTFSSLPSILTGALPLRHGVYSPRHRSGWSVERTVFSLPGLNGSMNLQPGQEIIHSESFPGVPGASLDTLQEPFFHVEHDMGGHIPYGLNDIPLDELFSDHLASRKDLLRAYRQSVTESMERLERILDTLEDSGILEETLVIVTSDHGELLYEYGGLTAHVRPVTPELVYVPTSFIYPGGNAGDLPSFIHHLDLIPTILDILGYEADWGLTGQNVFDPGYCERPAENFTRFFPSFLKRIGEVCMYEQASVWDHQGGHVFLQGKRLKRLGAFLTDLLLTRKFAGGQWGGLSPSDLANNAKLYLRDDQTFGKPEISRESAAARIMDAQPMDSSTYAIDDNIEKRLQELGYM